MLLKLLDGLANRYHTTPWKVLDWSVREFCVNREALLQWMASRAQIIRQLQGSKGMLALPIPVVLV